MVGYTSGMEQTAPEAPTLEDQWARVVIDDAALADLFPGSNLLSTMGHTTGHEITSRATGKKFLIARAVVESKDTARQLVGFGWPLREGLKDQYEKAAALADEQPFQDEIPVLVFLLWPVDGGAHGIVSRVIAEGGDYRLDSDVHQAIEDLQANRDTVH